MNLKIPQLKIVFFFFSLVILLMLANNFFPKHGLDIGYLVLSIYQKKIDVYHLCSHNGNNTCQLSFQKIFKILSYISIKS